MAIAYLRRQCTEILCLDFTCNAELFKAFLARCISGAVCRSAYFFGGFNYFRRVKIGYQLAESLKFVTVRGIKLNVPVFCLRVSSLKFLSYILS